MQPTHLLSIDRWPPAQSHLIPDFHVKGVIVPNFRVIFDDDYGLDARLYPELYDP